MRLDGFGLFVNDMGTMIRFYSCLLYTSDAADE